MFRRFFVVTLLAIGLVAGGALVPDAASAAGPQVGSTSLPPVRETKFRAQALAVPLYPYADTFKLHSNPGAQRVIYLDFNGEVLSGTAWNDEFANGATINAPAYDSDGSPSSFSNGEHDIIQAAWLRVAEDYAPFDVDVTTEDPGAAAITRAGSTDLQFGTRALISNMTQGYSQCGCAGIGYIGTFDLTANHARYQPALIFGKALQAYDKDVAEVISHEVGHNLGLDHDGKGSTEYYGGHGAWAPIMGAGYGRPLSQFSKGEYTGASTTEDDFAVMQSNSLPLRADDHGNTTAAATAVPNTGTPAGVIATDADVDVFSFVANSATTQYTAKAASKGPNLDLKLEMLSASGTVVASADPASGSTNYDTATGIDATVNASTTVGATYYLRVQGVGSGDPASGGYSGYGSVGRYSLTGPSGTTPPPATPSVSIADLLVAEGNSGTANASFTVSLSAASASPVTLTATTSNTTATAGSDYTATTATVTVPAGQTSAPFNVPVVGDTTPEPTERFTVTLTNPSGATIADGSATGSIGNDDGIGISINDLAKFEGASGAYTTFSFTVTLSSVSTTSSIGVTLQTANGTAVSSSDYVAKTQTLTFAPGEKTKNFKVTVRGDAGREASETFLVNLTSPTGTGGKITDAQGVGTIRNDD